MIMYYHYGQSRCFLVSRTLVVRFGREVVQLTPYCTVNKTIGYEDPDFQFGWNKLDFASGWPVVVDLDGKSSILRKQYVSLCWDQY